MRPSRDKWTITFGNSINSGYNTENIDYGFHRHTHTFSWYTEMNDRFMGFSYESTWKDYLTYAGWASWDYAEDATKNAKACWRANVVY